MEKVFITLANSEVSGEPVHSRSLTRAIAVCIHNIRNKSICDAFISCAYVFEECRLTSVVNDKLSKSFRRLSFTPVNPFWYFLAYLSRMLIGELIGYVGPSFIVRRPSSVIVHTFVNIFSSETTQPIKVKLSYGTSLEWENENLFKWFWSDDQDGRHVHIW